jgi:NAD dependent epimerase/dehydratase family enzyme
MDIAVSGSHGLIGTALADALVAEGHRVAALNRPGGSTRSDAIAWDPVAGTIDSSSLEGIDAVVHLAGAPIGDKRWSDERKRTLVDSRVEPTRLLAETLGGLDRPP